MLQTTKSDIYQAETRKQELMQEPARQADRGSAHIRREKKMETEYRKRQEKLRIEAREWQTEFSERSLSYAEIAKRQAYFCRLGRRFGLLREFHENAIC